MSNFFSNSGADDHPSSGDNFLSFKDAPLFKNDKSEEQAAGGSFFDNSSSTGGGDHDMKAPSNHPLPPRVREVSLLSTAPSPSLRVALLRSSPPSLLHSQECHLERGKTRVLRQHQFASLLFNSHLLVPRIPPHRSSRASLIPHSGPKLGGQVTALPQASVHPLLFPLTVKPLVKQCLSMLSRVPTRRSMLHQAMVTIM